MQWLFFCIYWQLAQLGLMYWKEIFGCILPFFIHILWCEIICPLRDKIIKFFDGKDEMIVNLLRSSQPRHLNALRWNQN